MGSLVLPVHTIIAASGLKIGGGRRDEISCAMTQCSLAWPPSPGPNISPNADVMAREQLSIRQAQVLKKLTILYLVPDAINAACQAD